MFSPLSRADVASNRMAHLISPMAAAEEARRGLQGIQLEDNPSAAAARANGRAGVPVLVKRLDAPARDYYVVPWQDERGVMLVVQVDATTGAMSSVAVLPEPVQSLLTSPDEIRRAVVERLGERVIGEPRLAWRPCRESSSPFQPFYQVSVESGDVFVSLDGSVFRNLTPFGRGG